MSKGRKTSAQPTPPTTAPKYGGIKVPVTVVVTREDIDNGYQRSCTRCPIALALFRALGITPTDAAGAPFGVVDDRVSFYDSGPINVSRLPLIAREFILCFDTLTGISAEPFSFDLQVPVELVK